MASQPRKTRPEVARWCDRRSVILVTWGFYTSQLTQAHVLESVLDALTCSFFPGEKGYGGLAAARDARPYIGTTFGAYGSIDPVDKKRCDTDLPSPSKKSTNS